MKNFKYIKKCQVSGSKKLKKILSLGNIPFVNDTHKINSNNLITISAPLELYYCPISKLVQLNIEVDKKILFPKSKIIHCSRNPKDNCLSLYKNFFEY